MNLFLVCGEFKEEVSFLSKFNFFFFFQMDHKWSLYRFSFYLSSLRKLSAWVFYELFYVVDYF